MDDATLTLLTCIVVYVVIGMTAVRRLLYGPQALRRNPPPADPEKLGFVAYLLAIILWPTLVVRDFARQRKARRTPRG